MDPSGGAHVTSDSYLQVLDIFAKKHREEENCTHAPDIMRERKIVFCQSAGEVRYLVESLRARKIRQVYFDSIRAGPRAVHATKALMLQN